MALANFFVTAMQLFIPDGLRIYAPSLKLATQNEIPVKVEKQVSEGTPLNYGISELKKDITVLNMIYKNK